jgi:hypothetical protein
VGAEVLHAETYYRADIIKADCRFLAGFAKLRKATTGFVMVVRPSAWNTSALSGRIFMKFDIRNFFRKSAEKNHVLLICDKNNGHFI